MDSARTVLLVDDDATLLAVIAALLRKSGYTVFPAASVAEALDILKQHPVSAIVTDLHMPRLSGLDLLNEIASTGKKIPGILVTGTVTTEESHERSPGVSAVLLKPIGSRTLIRTLERLLAEE
jgi:CheY-like chemotaxis protein